MRKNLTEYFYYTRGERNGAIVLVTLAFTFLIVLNVLPSLLKSNEKKYDHSFFEKEITAFQAAMPLETVDNTEGVSTSRPNNSALFIFDPNTATVEEFIQLGISPKVATIIQHYREKGGRFFKKEDLTKIYGLKPDIYNRIEQFIEIKNDRTRFEKGFKNDFSKPFEEAQNVVVHDIKVFPFDPNTASENELLTLGIDEKVVKNLLKFREKNGKFYKNEDLKKIYGFSEIDYMRLEKYIQLPNSQRFDKDSKPIDLKRKEGTIPLQPIDVNTANIEQWLEIRGIGRTFASRIVEHREKLGGYTSLEQLKEIHGLPDSTYQSIVPQLKLTTAVYRKISINNTTQNYLHPYLSQRQVAALVRYRVNHGNFRSIEEIKKVGVFTDDNLNKLKPYIDFN
jgi:competence protein ComEA